VAGAYARGGASFQYRRGPDGRNYAVGGEVPIDTSKEATPEETMTKMRMVRAVALAPADPSPQDLKVAGAAAAAISEAKKEMQVMEIDARLRAVRRGDPDEETKGYPAAIAAARYEQTGSRPPAAPVFSLTV